MMKIMRMNNYGYFRYLPIYFILEIFLFLIIKNKSEIKKYLFILFKDDYFQTDFSMTSDKIKFRIDPWNEASNTVKLNEGRNIVFADKDPTLENVGIFENGQ